MNSRDRVQTVIQRKEPDRIPTFEWDIDPGLISSMTGGGTYEDFIEKFDLDAWNPPDPHASHRTSAMKERIARFKGERAILLPLRDVWSNPRDLLGYEGLLLKCALDPDFVGGLIKKCIDHSISMLEIAANLGGEIVMSGDDIADNQRTLISPKMWEQIFMAQFKRWVTAIHQHGMYYWKHTDGNINAVEGGLVDASIDGIDPIDPIAGLDLASFKQEWGHHVAIKGNVDCASVLVDGTEADVIAAIKTCIMAAGEKGGYACSSSNLIHSGVDPKLYITMLDAIRKFGVYPLDMDRLA